MPGRRFWPGAGLQVRHLRRRAARCRGQLEVFTSHLIGGSSRPSRRQHRRPRLGPWTQARQDLLSLKDPLLKRAVVVHLFLTGGPLGYLSPRLHLRSPRRNHSLLWRSTSLHTRGPGRVRKPRAQCLNPRLHLKSRRNLQSRRPLGSTSRHTGGNNKEAQRRLRRGPLQLTV